jgi:hypothetical protein
MGLQTSDLLSGERSPLPQRQIAKVQIALTHPNKAQHIIAKQTGNLADLSLAPFAQYNPCPGSIFNLLLLLNPGRSRLLAVEFHPSPPFTKRIRRKGPIKESPIFLFYGKTRVRQPMSQLAIIGQQNQALAIHIKAPDGEDPRRYINKINHRLPSLRVISGGNKANWFMKHQVGAFDRPLHGLSIKQNHILSQVNPCAWFLYHLPIYRNPTCCNNRLAITSRSNARTSEHFLKSFCAHGNPFSSRRC